MRYVLITKYSYYRLSNPILDSIEKTRDLS